MLRVAGPGGGPAKKGETTKNQGTEGEQLRDE